MEIQDKAKIKIEIAKLTALKISTLTEWKSAHSSKGTWWREDTASPEDKMEYQEIRNEFDSAIEEMENLIRNNQ